MYSPETGRYLTKDSWPGNDTIPMSYNAWLYVDANPVNLTDPSGYKPVVILACGERTNGACESGTPLPDYDNKVPLSPFANCASQKGYSVKYYDDLTNKATLAGDIQGYMAQQENASFILVGHSAGADAVIWATSLYLNSGQSGRILGVMVLDMDLDANYNQSDINNIIKRGIPVKAFHSFLYSLPQPANSTLVMGDIFYTLWEKYTCKTKTGLNNHKYLAVGQTGFDKYMKPILNDWSR